MHYSAFMDSVDLNLLTALDVVLTEHDSAKYRCAKRDSGGLDRDGD